MGIPSSNRWVFFYDFRMNKIPFNKPALTISQQITKLQSRGLIINGTVLAENALRNLNYYRLSGYWLQFEVKTLSCWYKNLKEIPSKNPNCQGNAKDAIASFYNVPSIVLESWIHSLSVLRNHCAHQSRVILKQIAIQPMKPKSNKIAISQLWSLKENCLYNLILILVYLNEQISLPLTWKKDFICFLKHNSSKCIDFLNFPHDWEQNRFWIV